MLSYDLKFAFRSLMLRPMPFPNAGRHLNVDVGARDAATYIAAVLILAAAAAAANFIPARRAAAVDPIRALRFE